MHTPAPWKFDGIHYIFAETPNGPQMVAETRGTGWGAPQEENGALIAAAPELLEALKSFPGFTDDATIGDPWIERVRELIARAEGKERG
jgi:hypothetical protein